MRKTAHLPVLLVLFMVVPGVSGYFYSAYLKENPPSPLHGFLYLSGEPYSGYYFFANTNVTVDLYIYFWDKPIDPDEVNVTANQYDFKDTTRYPINMTRVGVGHYRGVFKADLHRFYEGMFSSSSVEAGVRYGGYNLNISRGFKVTTPEREGLAITLWADVPSPRVSESPLMVYSVSGGEVIPIYLKFTRWGMPYDPELSSLYFTLKMGARTILNSSDEVGLRRLSEGFYTFNLTIPDEPEYYGRYTFYVSYRDDTVMFGRTYRRYIYFTYSPLSIWYHLKNVGDDFLLDVLLWNGSSPCVGANISAKYQNTSYHTEYAENVTDEVGFARLRLSQPRIEDGVQVDLQVKYNNRTYFFSIDHFTGYANEADPFRFKLAATPEEGVFQVERYYIIPSGQENHLTYKLHYNRTPLPHNPVVVYITTNYGLSFIENLTTDGEGLFTFNFTPPEAGDYLLVIRAPVEEEGNTVWASAQYRMTAVNPPFTASVEDFIDENVKISTTPLFRGGYSLKVSWRYEGELPQDSEGFFHIFTGDLQNITFSPFGIFLGEWNPLSLGGGTVIERGEGGTYTLSLLLPEGLPQDEPVTLLCGYIKERFVWDVAYDWDEIYNTTSDIRFNFVTLNWRDPAGTLSGRVTDEWGGPLENVTVTAGDNSTFTDSQGYYSLDLSPGVYNVSFWKEGYLNATGEAAIEVGHTTYLNVTLSLPETPGAFWSDLIVVVKNSTGSPVKNATVSISFRNLTATTNTSGEAVFRRVPEEVVEVSVTCPGYLPYSTQVHLLENTTTYLNVTLREIPPYPTGAVKGTVIDSSTMEPIEGARIVLTSSTHTFTAISLANGTFLLSYLPAGNYTLTVEKEGYQGYMDAVTVRPNATTTLSIPLFRYPEPVIYGGGVRKEGGKYTFEVTYRDPQGRAPEGVYVVIDGEEHEMELEGGNLSSGATYSLSIDLKEGEHSYYFRVLGPEGEPLEATDSTPYSEETQGSLQVEGKKSGAPYLLLGIAALVIAALIALLLLTRSKGEGVEE